MLHCCPVMIHTIHGLKVHEIFPKIKKSYLPSLATCCENMASNSKQIMEKSRNFQIVYAGRTNLCKHLNTDHARGIMKLGVSQPPHSPIVKLSLPLEVVTISYLALLGECSPYWGQVSSRKQSRCGRHGLSNILKLKATFLYSIYHQQAGKTNLFHMRGGRFHAFNT